MKQKYALSIAAALPLAVVSLTANAQANKEKIEDQEKVHVLYVPESDSATIKMETLSGIHLTPTKKGTFQLDFRQELKEDARLEIKNKAGKLIYRAPVSIADNKQDWQFNVGKLKPDTYHVAVKTSDTTYWTKFKISR